MLSSENERVAMFRFGIIAALVCRRFENKIEERLVRQEILKKQWQYPDGSVRGVSERTLRYWLERYRRYGVDGLYDGLRKDRANKGRYRAISGAVLEKAERLRRELPERSVRVIIELLELQGVDTSKLSERTLQRHLKRLNATRQKIERGEEYFQRWEQVRANDMWQGDTAHAVWLPDPTNPNKMKRTKLIVLIDDATRVCTHGEFYFDEKLPSLIDTFSKALVSHGKPRRLLLDNAFIFHSTTLGSMCAELTTELSFCKPRRPQGKGKIERFIRTVKEGFVSEANRGGFTGLEDLNTAFRAWLQKHYHESVHSELGMTPLERWQKDVDVLIPVTDEEIGRALMLRARRRVSEQTATIALDGEDYQTAPCLLGQTVEIRWHPDRTETIEVWQDGRFFQMAQLVGRPASVFPKTVLAVEEPSYPPLSSSKDYLSNLTVGSAQLKLVRPASDQFLACDEFVQLVARHLEKSLSQRELDRLGEFFRTFAPLKKSVTESAMQQAVRVKGAALHLRYYLQHLEQIAQSSRRQS